MPSLRVDLYTAPEILDDAPYNEKVDTWSLGVICYVLLCGSLPFYSENELEISDLVLAGKYDLGETDSHWLKVSESAKDLIKNLLTLDPNKRLSAEEVLAHPFISGERKLNLTKRRSVKWNAAGLLGKWPLKFRHILDSVSSAHSSNGSTGDDDAEDADKSNLKITFNGNKSPPINAMNAITIQFSDASELDTENSAVE